MAGLTEKGAPGKWVSCKDVHLSITPSLRMNCCFPLSDIGLLHPQEPLPLFKSIFKPFLKESPFTQSKLVCTGSGFKNSFTAFGNSFLMKIYVAWKLRCHLLEMELFLLESWTRRHRRTDISDTCWSSLSFTLSSRSLRSVMLASSFCRCSYADVSIACSRGCSIDCIVTLFSGAPDTIHGC